jgi:hypothetical protein
MIPAPLITFVLSKGITAFFNYISARSEAKEKQHNRLISIATHDEDSQRDRNKITNREFQWTKRFLAVTAWSVYWGTKVALLFGIAVLPAVYGEPVTTHHGFWIFGWTKTQMVFTEVPGVPFTSFDYHMLAAIVGSYFGSSIMKRG